MGDIVDLFRDKLAKDQRAAAKDVGPDTTIVGAEAKQLPCPHCGYWGFNLFADATLRCMSCGNNCSLAHET